MLCSREEVVVIIYIMSGRWKELQIKYERWFISYIALRAYKIRPVVSVVVILSVWMSVSELSMLSMLSFLLLRQPGQLLTTYCLCCRFIMTTTGTTFWQLSVVFLRSAVHGVLYLQSMKSSAKLLFLPFSYVIIGIFKHHEKACCAFFP